ncbi:MAG: DUF1275 domain-containing protein [Oscillospiraceae bacterium]|nr:DUF1275 domain-containing protein [Oscillospiraceae bacterium]
MIEKRAYPENERQWVFRVLMVVAGFYGGYAMLVRGGVFSNAQTGNLALCALALGKGQWQEAAYYVIPISAYLLGCMVSEILTKSLRRTRFMRWETVLILLEIAAAVVMGFIPSEAPHQICQVIINVICAMQFTTFRQAEGISMATTFCTNHVRQIGIALASLFRRDPEARKNLRIGGIHGIMVLCFMAGVAASAIACGVLGVKAIWCVLPPLAVLFGDLLRAERKEKTLAGE